MRYMRKMLKRVTLGCSILLCSYGAIAQTATNAESKMQYEVVSVRPDKSTTGNVMIGGMADGFKCENCSLKTLITMAYGIREDLVFGGPAWGEHSGFDLEAKVSGEDVAAYKKFSFEQRRPMLIPVLEERFGLKVHREMRTMQVYELTVAKGGAKIHPPDANSPEEMKGGGMSIGRGGMGASPGRIAVNGVVLSAFVNQLSYILKRTVTDKTGLSGEYYFDLHWTPDEQRNHNDALDASKAQGEDSGPSLFTAVEEQLGLKLQPAKGPVETLVIDSAQMPSAN